MKKETLAQKIENLETIIANIPTLLEKVEDQMRKLRVGDDDLWRAEEIADHVKLDKKTVQNTLLNKKSFPNPVIIPTSKDGSGGGKRWQAGKVKSWALKHIQIKK